MALIKVLGNTDLPIIGAGPKHYKNSKRKTIQVLCKSDEIHSTKIYFFEQTEFNALKDLKI